MCERAAIMSGACSETSSAQQFVPNCLPEHQHSCETRCAPRAARSARRYVTCTSVLLVACISALLNLQPLCNGASGAFLGSFAAHRERRASAWGHERFGRPLRALDLDDLELLDLDDEDELEDDWEGDDDTPISQQTQASNDNVEEKPSQEELWVMYQRQKHGVDDEEAEFLETLVERMKLRPEDQQSATPQEPDKDYDWRKEIDDFVAKKSQTVAGFEGVGGGLSSEKWTNIILNDTWEMPVAQVPGSMQRNVVFAQTHTEDDPEALEEFASGDTLWPASIILSRWLVIGPPIVPPLVGRTVIELGAGCGLPSVTAARLGAAQVLMQDRLAEPLKAGIETAVMHGFASEVSTLSCAWRDLPARIFEDGESVLKKFVDVDVVLGADILYDDARATDVADTLSALLRSPGQVAYIVDPLRRYHRDGFKARCEEHGLQVEDKEIVTWEPDWDDHLETEWDWANRLLTVRRVEE